MSGLNFLKEGQTFRGERCFTVLRDLEDAETSSKVVIVDSVIGSGNFGVVRQACIDSGCNYALKITPIRPPPQSDFLPSFEAASLDASFKITSPLVFRDTWIRNMRLIASTTRIFPKVYESWLCRDSQNQFVAVTLMEKFDYDLEDFLNGKVSPPFLSRETIETPKGKKVFVEKALEIINDRMIDEYKLWNFDTHVGNFMFKIKVDPKTKEAKIKVRFVDLDFTFPLQTKEKLEEARQKMIKNFKRSIEGSIDDFKAMRYFVGLIDASN